MTNEQKQTAAEPFLWLQERETSGRADCGCVLEYAPDASFYLCPMHKAAPALLEALERLEWAGITLTADGGHKPFACPSCANQREEYQYQHRSWCQLNNAIRAARGEE